MIKTVNDVFLSALSLMAEDPENADDYKTQVLPIFNIMMIELFDANNVRRQFKNLEPFNEVPQMESLDSVIPYEFSFAYGALPYGLAAKLCLDDDAGKASYFNAEWQERKNQFTPTLWVDIAEPYNGAEV